MVGNSSSGIVEVPSFLIPTVNIGNRQEGRLQPESVIQTGYSVNEIYKGIEKALYDIDKDTSMELLWGSKRGGYECSGGTCAQLPPFKGIQIIVKRVF